MEREEAIRQIENRWSIMDYGESEALGEALDMAIEALHREEAEEKGYCHRIRPSNVEVVVRCKDCRHRVFTKDGESNPHDIVCDYHMSDGFDETDFCSYAERREP